MKKMKNIKIISRVFVIFLGLANLGVNAVSYKWPVIESADVTITGSDSATYVLHFGYPTIPDNSTLDQIPTACESGSCVFIVTHRHNDGAGTITANPNDIPSSYVSEWKRGTEWRNILKDTTNFGVSSFTVKHFGGVNGQECVDAALAPSVYRGSSGVSHLWSEWQGARATPPNFAVSCLGLPPVNQWCALHDPLITFDFGTLQLADAKGAKRKENIQIDCSVAGMKYVLKLRGLDFIALNNGMNAKFTADGKPLGETLEGTAVSNIVALEAELTGTPPQDGGDFSGTSILSVSYP
ncbi:hypothetical protein [Hafnia alvei]|nr:hypothetical protein [Hafnia alvei]NLS54881.1 hypothetical protein [Hafnia alvei]